jgi:hypothetical protein
MPWVGGVQDPCDDRRPHPLAGLGRIVPLAPFDLAGWKRGNLQEKMRIAALSWADNGFGAQRAVYAFYLVKHVAWLCGWRLFCSVSRPEAELFEWTSLATTDGMARLVLFNLLFEVLGLGCASGPLTGRTLLPVSAVLHWLWPGSMKLPWRLDLRDGQKPVFPAAGTERSLFDIALFLGFVASVLCALTAPQIGTTQTLPVVLCLFTIGIFDCTIWLAARSEVYLYMTVCLLLGDGGSSAWTGIKMVQLGIWCTHPHQHTSALTQ